MTIDANKQSDNYLEKVIDGKKLSESICKTVESEVRAFKAQLGIAPKLAVILVGDDGASQVYVAAKKKRAESLGILSIDYFLPSTITQTELTTNIDALNEDPLIHGILLQLPLPPHLDKLSALQAICPLKDVDCFHPENIGLLHSGCPRFIPCTPKGCLYMIKSVMENLSGKNAVIIGRSNVVGWPMSRLLIQEDATVTVLHSKSENIADHCRGAEIIIVAAGKLGLLTADMVNKKSIVIDVGINRISSSKKIVGDVDFDSLLPKVRAISPVPGGVGPMTIACLMENIMIAAKISL